MTSMFGLGDDEGHALAPEGAFDGPEFCYKP
jgi:hypothetical protein